jgi:hypothetical protein
MKQFEHKWVFKDAFEKGFKYMKQDEMEKLSDMSEEWIASGGGNPTDVERSPFRADMLELRRLANGHHLFRGLDGVLEDVRGEKIIDESKEWRKRANRDDLSSEDDSEDDSEEDSDDPNEDERETDERFNDEAASMYHLPKGQSDLWLLCWEDEGHKEGNRYEAWRRQCNRRGA